MNALDELNGFGFTVRWRTILAGWNGPAKNPRQIGAREVIDAAVDRLVSDPEVGGDVLRLASLETSETEEIKSVLVRLAKQEGLAESLEVRKWRVLLLTRALANLPDSPLHAWITLGEVWESFGHPEDANVIYDVFDNVAPADLYTPEMRQMLIRVQQRWIEKEIQAILAAEGD